ncbi:telomerase Cajal body protein 1-like [Glandiceps talaboti]
MAECEDTDTQDQLISFQESGNGKDDDTCKVQDTQEILYNISEIVNDTDVPCTEKPSEVVKCPDSDEKNENVIDEEHYQEVDKESVENVSVTLPPDVTSDTCGNETEVVRPVVAMEMSGCEKPTNSVEVTESEIEVQNNAQEKLNDKTETLQCDKDDYMDYQQTGTSPYGYDFNGIPIQLTGAWQSFEETQSNFLKGCKWSPDGSCILTNSDDDRLRLFNLPTEIYEGQYMDIPEMTSALTTVVGELVYDYTWYPLMNSTDPTTCSFVSSSRGHPIQMWDAFTGELRCTYRAFDHLDEMTTPHSVAFSLDGNMIYSGFNKMIRVFNTDRPGRQCEDRPTHVKKMGQAGIISCIAMNPQQTDMYAAGSFSKSVGVYSEKAAKNKIVYLLQGHQGGVTHLKFSPDGNLLYSGGRKDPEILCWDLRNPGVVLYKMVRNADTNQRMYFDIDSTGQFIVSGNDNGSLTVWDTHVSPTTDNTNDNEPTLQPVLTYVAHYDSVNGVSLHHTLPLMATVSGQRKFPVPMATDSDNDDEMTTDKIETDNSLRLWACMRTSGD